METLKSITKNILAIIFARVSSREQEETGYSLPAQEKFLQEYAKRQDTNLDVAKVFQISEAASGKVDRKIFKEMLNYAKKNKIPNIVVETTDRLTRNFADVPMIDAWIMEDESHQIHLAKEGCILNKNSKSHEWFMWRVKVATAEYYVRLLSENVKKGQKEKISQGWLPTTPPLGYKTIGEKGHKIIVVDKKVAPHIVKMFELYATGNYSTKSLVGELYKRGLRSRTGSRVGKSQIHKLLCEPFYYGKFVWNDKEYQGKHKPIITQDLFEKVREKITRGCSPYHSKLIKELTGKIKCGRCGKTVTWEIQKGHRYGGCKQCKAQLAKERQYIRQEDLESDLLGHLASIAPKGEQVLEVLKKALKESHSEEIAYHETQVQSINNTLQRIQQRMATMYDDRLDGRITAEEYDHKLKTFSKEKGDLLNALEKLKSDNTEYYKVGFAIHELASKAREIYLSKKITTEERRLLLAYSFSSISVLKGEITPEYTKSFGLLAKWMPKVNKSLEVLEPTQKTAEIIISDGDLHSLIINNPIELSEVEINSRTSKKLSVKARHEDFTLTSRSLLRGLDSNQRPIA
jgi:site-specific DNA recombinase